MQRQSTCARSHCSPLLSLSLFSLVSMHGFASRDSGSCLCADAFHRLLCSRGVARSAWYNNRRANIRPQAARSIRNGTGNWLPDRFSWAKIHKSPKSRRWDLDGRRLQHHRHNPLFAPPSRVLRARLFFSSTEGHCSWGGLFCDAALRERAIRPPAHPAHSLPEVSLQRQQPQF
jgi:hypothetical protein